MASNCFIRLLIASIFAAIGSRLIIGLFLMLRARLAYLSVLSVSSKLVSDGEQHAIIKVLLLPPNESCSSRVIFASLNGTWAAFLFSSPKAEMTLPRANNPLLMLIPSFILSPVAPVRLTLSDPAKSTKWNLDTMVSCRTSALSLSSTCLVCTRIMLKMACERLEVAFIAVDPVTRHAVPLSRESSMSSGHFTASSIAPKTLIPPLVSRIERSDLPS
mmetsp:Transcript_40057/g.77967  ORF Transcript_40057/g.77967 Transcript_40057/m.77967 type:complete len:217 (-) Transcript_40057:509-1159(-)